MALRHAVCGTRAQHRLRVRCLHGVDDRIVSLAHSHRNDKEATLYIKGFATNSDTPGDFQRQRASHAELVRRLRWSPRCMGYRWEAQRLPVSIPVPLASMAYVAYTAYTRTKFLRFANPASAVLLLGVEAGLSVAQVVYNYHSALAFVDEHAVVLAEKLRYLAKHYAYVRMVAHSLGAALLLSALRKIDAADWPRGEAHLLAPALTDSEYRDVFARQTGSQCPMQVYYSPSDYVLGYLFSLYHEDDPIGLVGSALVPSLDVSRYFSMFVHNAYARTLGEFCVDLRPRALPPQ